MDSVLRSIAKGYLVSIVSSKWGLYRVRYGQISRHPIPAKSSETAGVLTILARLRIP